jgi:hypothetical protein
MMPGLIVLIRAPRLPHRTASAITRSEFSRLASWQACSHSRTGRLPPGWPSQVTGPDADKAAPAVPGSRANRVREFGTLKALGWRSRRIIRQIMGEALVIGLVGGVAGVALGFGGAALVQALAPPLTATTGTASTARPDRAGLAARAGAAASRAPRSPSPCT